MERGTALRGGQPAQPEAVSVVASHQLLVRRMVAALGAEGVAAAPHRGSADEAAANGARHAAAIVLACDLSRPHELAALRRLVKEAGRPVVVVSPAMSGTGVRRALAAGAAGVVFEAELEAVLAASVRAVIAGQVAVPRELRGCLHKPAFSHREKQVLRLVAEGLTNHEIAERLYLSESTVKSHLSTSFEKLGVRSRKEAAAMLLDPESGLAASVSLAASA